MQLELADVVRRWPPSADPPPLFQPTRKLLDRHCRTAKLLPSVARADRFVTAAKGLEDMAQEAHIRVEPAQHLGDVKRRRLQLEARVEDGPEGLKDLLRRQWLWPLHQVVAVFGARVADGPHHLLRVVVGTDPKESSLLGISDPAATSCCPP